MASTAFSPALRDQAASLIGQYLLQGYRMLAEHCGECTVSYYHCNDDSIIHLICRRYWYKSNVISQSVFYVKNCFLIEKHKHLHQQQVRDRR